MLNYKIKSLYAKDNNVNYFIFYDSKLILIRSLKKLQEQTHNYDQKEGKYV